MKLGWAIFYVQDPRRSQAFYERAFGLRTSFASDDGSWIELDTGAARLGFFSLETQRATLAAELRAPGADGPIAPQEIALVTDDVDAAYQRAVAAGAAPLMAPTKKPWGQTVAYVRDCDGFLVELCTPIG